ncbi:MAG: YfiR family protein [Cytophagales bacterium]|nr:YfiR family protein [Cytophagales bacterium]
MKRTMVIIFFILSLSINPTTLKAQVSKFQALYLLNFSRNLDWDTEAIQIAVIGSSKTFDELSELTSKYPNVSVRKVRSTDPIHEFQMIFLPASQSKNFNLLQDKIGSSKIVLVVENEDLVSKGAEIGFSLEGNKLKFSMNRGSIYESAVIVNDKLFSLASAVIN